jgi:type II secretion system protein D
MSRIALFICLILAGIMLSSQAQIPAQPRINPNAVPPPNAGARPFVRPGASAANTPRPGGPANAARPAGAVNGDPAEDKPAMKPEDAIKADGGVELQFPNTPLSQILLVYEDLTGLKIIRDANAEQATVSIETTGELPKEKAIMFIEKSLLLNGYSFVPAGEGMVKLLAFDAKKPQTEGAPFIESEMELPLTDQVVNFVVILKYLNGEDAVKAIDQVIPRHSYGVLTPVPNAKALVITENSNTIRSILSLLERLDSKPAETLTETITLTRSDAEDIKKALDEILGIDEKNANGGSGRTPSIPQNQPGTVPGQPVQPQIPLNPAGQLASVGSTGSSSAEAAPPKIYAIVRRNCLLVTASADTMVYIKTLIQELDAPSELRNFVSRALNYLSVESAMTIISDAITRTEGDSEGGSGNTPGGAGQNGQNQTNTNNTQNNQNRNGGLFGNNNNNSFGNNGLGGSNDFGGGLGGGGLGGSGGANLQPLRQNNGPTSLLIGKTLLISDPIANTVFASGPPEHLRILNEIMDELDHRPQQIIINAVIGEHTVALDHEVGFLTMLRKRGSNLFRAGGLASGGVLDPRSATPLKDLAANVGLTYFGNLGSGIDVALRLYTSDTDFQVLSRPTLFTTNNTPVNITSGQSIPIQSSSQNLGTAGGLISNVQYQDVLLSLSVVPLINTPDEITLQISQSNSELGADRTIGGSEYPELTKQEYNTTIVCRNKSAVLLGGLMRKDDRKSNTSIPFIGKLPILKHLTADRSKAVNQRELLIFIEPRIVEGMHDLPPSINDNVGKSIHADNLRAAFEQEKHDAVVRDQPVEKLKPSERLKQMVKKLFE